MTASEIACNYFRGACGGAADEGPVVGRDDATLKRRAKTRGDNNEARAQDKLSRALAGAPIRGFSALEIARLRPTEIALVREEVSARMGKLTAEQRAAFSRNSWMALLSRRLCVRQSPHVIRYNTDIGEPRTMSLQIASLEGSAADRLINSPSVL